MAIAAVDVALWDLKARLLELPLCRLLGAVRDERADLRQRRLHQLRRRAPAGAAGRLGRAGHPAREDEGRPEPARDPLRVRRARAGDRRGRRAVRRRQRRLHASRRRSALAEDFAEQGRCRWFEEPVSSDDLAGLRAVRERVPAGMEVAAGEYGYDLPYFARMLDAEAVDVLQADVTRCAGITELLRVDALCRARGRPLSLHCGPAVHAHVAAALSQFVHLEYFHDHERIERMLFDGVLEPRDGALWPDLTAPGMGLELKRREAQAVAA